MAPLTAAIVGFTVKAFSDNEEAKQLKNDVFGGFVKWVRPLFVKDDPVSEAVLTKADTPEATKAAVVEAKLGQLLQDESLKATFADWVTKLQAAGVTEKNVVRDANIEAEGDIRIGDSGADAAVPEACRGGAKLVDRKNIVENSKLKSGGSFHLGDKN